jgi:hypothetical protein
MKRKEALAPADWAHVIQWNGCVCVESARDTSIQRREFDKMTVYGIPVLQVSHPEIQEAIWIMADLLDGLVLAELGQLIRRPHESIWIER